MKEKQPKDVLPSKGGVLKDMFMRLKLILRLMADPRINVLLKLIPLGSLLYLIVPDLIPTPIDDAAVIWLGFYFFVELCPPQIVEEHLAALSKETKPGFSKGYVWGKTDEDIIEGEFRDEK
jgi:hypothetical protein